MALILTLTVSSFIPLVPKTQPEAKIEEKEAHKPLTRVIKQRKNNINKSALRELKYKPKQLPILGKKETYSKKKGGISLEEMQEQYNWLHNAKQIEKVSTSEPKVNWTIDHTSLIVPKICTVESKVTQNVTPRRKEEINSNLTFLLQFKRNPKVNISSTA